MKSYVAHGVCTMAADAIDVVRDQDWERKTTVRVTVETRVTVIPGAYASYVSRAHNVIGMRGYVGVTGWGQMAVRSFVVSHIVVQ